MCLPSSAGTGQREGGAFTEPFEQFEEMLFTVSSKSWPENWPQSWPRFLNGPPESAAAAAKSSLLRMTATKGATTSYPSRSRPTSQSLSQSVSQRTRVGHVSLRREPSSLCEELFTSVEKLLNRFNTSAQVGYHNRPGHLVLRSFSTDSKFRGQGGDSIA